MQMPKPLVEQRLMEFMEGVNGTGEALWPLILKEIDDSPSKAAIVAHTLVELAGFLEYILNDITGFSRITSEQVYAVYTQGYNAAARNALELNDKKEGMA